MSDFSAILGESIGNFKLRASFRTHALTFNPPNFGIFRQITDDKGFEDVAFQVLSQIIHDDIPAEKDTRYL